MEENSRGPLVSTHVYTLAYTLSHTSAHMYLHTHTYTHTLKKKEEKKLEAEMPDLWESQIHYRAGNKAHVSGSFPH